MAPLISNSAAYLAGALVLLVVCKGLAYGASLSSFRAAPSLPAMFLGAADGIAMSYLPSLPLVPAVAMCIGAMSVAMLGLPLTSVPLAILLLVWDGLAVMPQVIVEEPARAPWVPGAARVVPEVPGPWPLRGGHADASRVVRRSSSLRKKPRSPQPRGPAAAEHLRSAVRGDP